MSEQRRSRDITATILDYGMRHLTQTTLRIRAKGDSMKPQRILAIATGAIGLAFTIPASAVQFGDPDNNADLPPCRVDGRALHHAARRHAAAWPGQRVVPERPQASDGSGRLAGIWKQLFGHRNGASASRLARAPNHPGDA